MYSSSDKLIDDLKFELKRLKQLSVNNPEQARKEALLALQRIGILDEESRLRYPYNGEKAKGDDFAYGPKGSRIRK